MLEPLVTPELYLGVLFLCCLPATVQSAIAFTSIARGNVPAAVCSASASSLLGIFITPLLVGTVVASAAAAPISFDAVGKIMLQLLLPFVLGQLLRPWIGAWVHRRKALLAGRPGIHPAGGLHRLLGSGQRRPVEQYADPGAAGVADRVLHHPGPGDGGLAAAGAAVQIRCGRPHHAAVLRLEKSLASGIPMAQVIFAGQAVGAIVLPLMLFHQIQLMVCAVLATRYGKRPD